MEGTFAKTRIRSSPVFRLIETRDYLLSPRVAAITLLRGVPIVVG